MRIDHYLSSKSRLFGRYSFSDATTFRPAPFNGYAEGSNNDQFGLIEVICGYRTPWSNKFLRTRSAHTGVARHSLHLQAEAIDIRLPGIPTGTVRDAALRLQRGGVGYYSDSDFVHVDVGHVRRW